jgi:transaldolase
MNPLSQLSRCGQSYWLDNLARHKIKSGELKRRVDEEDLRGITSNPAIFNKAIAGNDEYDAQIRELARKGSNVHEIYEALVITDVQDACDILRPVYDRTDGSDGFVSLEVSPHLAHDTEGTMREVRHLFGSVNRRNVLIKIPGTVAGVPAIEQMLYEGINVNVTLLFSIQAYEAVAKAYIRAMERRESEGKPLKDVASVASFFLSRIDVLVDQLLEERTNLDADQKNKPKPEDLLGKAAIARAKLAYRSFKQLFGGKKWKTLEKKGARVQRLLWASTSTKNPRYRDVYYVEPLIGVHTVNTMPDETAEAFARHGVVRENTIEQDLDASREALAGLEKLGIDPDLVEKQLIAEGVQKFNDPFDQLIASLSEKQSQFMAEAAGR